MSIFQKLYRARLRGADMEVWAANDTVEEDQKLESKGRESGKGKNSGSGKHVRKAPAR